MRNILLSITMLIGTSLFSQTKPELSQECLENLIYADYIDNDIDLALSLWRKAYTICPDSRKSLYINGGKMYIRLIEDPANELKRELYIDTLFSIFDQRIKYFGQEGLVTEKKAVRMLKYYPKELEMAMTTFEKSIQISGENLQNNTVVNAMICMVKMEKKGLRTKTDVIELFDRLSAFCGTSENKLKALAKIEELVSPYLDCEVLAALSEKNYDSNKHNEHWLRRKVSQFRLKKCYNTPIFKVMLENYMAINPLVANARLLSKIEIANKNYDKSLVWLNKSLELDSNNESKAKTYYEIAQVNLYKKNYSGVKTNALKAVSLKEKWGAPFILIGDAYMYSSNKCNDDKLGKWSVYWIAVDMYKKAKKVDTSLTEKANSKIKTCSNRFPEIRDIHYFPFKEGDTYNVGCWINEKTVVRLKK
jgi:tetratricopeptide (TPR) repeat protein